MSFTEKKFETTTISFFVVLGTLFVVISIDNSSNGSINQFLNYLIPLLVIIVAVLLLVEFVYSLRYILLLIDSYIDDMLSGKKYRQPSDKFYCQACKSEVGKDDNFCQNCGMTM